MENTAPQSLTADLQPRQLFLNLGLNDGTYAPQACVDALSSFGSRTAFRNYTSPDNTPLRMTIAGLDGVTPENIFIRNGSGALLKQVVPHLIKKAISRSPRRILRHVLSKNGYPIVTPRHTYSKVPKKAIELGLTVHLLKLSPENGFQLDLDELENKLKQGDGFVYIANPNNPTGNILVTREQLIPLLERFPNSHFWIDEAYVHYIDPHEHRYFTDLVPRYPNLMVSRTLSFAYGLAALRVGYLVADPNLVNIFESQITDYRIGMLAERLAVAALEDPDHLPFIRRKTVEARDHLRTGLSRFHGIESFPSQANFVLCRFKDGRKARVLEERMMARGIKIKTFPALGKEHFDEYFRITIGLPEENRILLGAMEEALDQALA